MFRQNDEATAFFVLLDGHIRVVKSTREGEDVTIRYVNPGELLGITQALGLDRYPATTVAVLDCVLLSWPKHLWTEFAQAFPSFAASTHKTVGERLVDAHNRAIELATDQVNKRVARALVRLADQAGLKTQDGIRIGFPILRQDIAEMTGTTLHTVSRLMCTWEDQGLVRSKRREVTILDRDKLLSLADAAALEA